MTWRDRRKRARQQEEARTWPHPGGGMRLFRDTDGCAECGDSLSGPGLLVRCAQFHDGGKAQPITIERT